MIGEVIARPFEPDFFRYIFVPIGIWLFGVIVLMTSLIWKFTLGKWTKNNPNPFQGETLGIPRGVMRGVLTLTLVYVVVLFETFNLNSSIPEEGYIEFLMAFKMMIAFYFGSKVAHHVASTEQKKAKLSSETAKAEAEASSDNFSFPANEEQMPDYEDESFVEGDETEEEDGSVG